MLEILGYLSAILIGNTLGIFGGGGSILTVPVLVYIFHLSPVLATAYSLFIVGIASMAGTISQLKERKINYRVAISFAIPGLTGTFFARKYLIPAIPEKISLINNLILTKDTAILIFFGTIMLMASFSMIKGRKDNNNHQKIIEPWNTLMIITGSLIIGLITGLVGAGGGFMIIPALVFLAKLPMKEAVATSILVISINSLVGFTGNIGLKMDYSFLMIFSLLTITGILMGIHFAKKIPTDNLKPAFGWFVMFMGTFIIIKEIFL